ncbi:MAG TPA: hypothetical protein VE465_29885 [Streptosporangiaceae bacterium]|jgi:hypothetical protein|nr:hypothetical protein [Streptosporangiaceae bacterium]
MTDHFPPGPSPRRGGDTGDESRLARRVLEDFPEPGSAPEVLRLLAGLAARGEALASERVQAAVVVLADGDFRRLRRAIDRAATDWRDVLAAAGLAAADWPRRLDAELGGGAPRAWLPAGEEWTDATGTRWTRHRPRWLTERAAKSPALRTSVVLAVERAGAPGQVDLLGPAAREDYWDRHVAGHVDDGSGGDVPPNGDGLTYRISVWRDPRGRRLVLLSEMC